MLKYCYVANVKKDRYREIHLIIEYLVFKFQRSQYRRGGLSLCLDDDHVAAEFRGLIERCKQKTNQSREPKTPRKNTCKNKRIKSGTSVN